MRLIIGVVLGGVFAGMMAWAVMQEGRVQCEVCLNYGGRSECRTGAGTDREAAVQGAIYNACAVMSSGVTDDFGTHTVKPPSW